MTTLLVKLIIDLLDFVETRILQTDTKNMFYWSINAFGILIFQIFINILMDLEIALPMTVIFILIGQIRIFNP